MLRNVFLVATCLFLHMLSCGMSISFGVLYREIRLEFGTSHMDAAWIASIYNGLLGFVGIALSLIVNKIGEKWPTVCGSVLLALGMLTSMFATKTTTVYLTYGLLAGTGSGILHYCAYTVLASHFNERLRPVAVACASAGVPLSALILPPIMTILIEQLDWRKTFMFLACLSILGLPASLIFFPKNENRNFKSESKSGQQSKRNISRFVKNVDYMFYLVSTFVVFLVLFAPATFLPDLMHEFERSSREVYICVMTMGATDLAARLLMGFLVQRKPSHLPLFHSVGLLVFSLSSGLVTFSRSFEAFIIMSGLIGVGSGCYSALIFSMSTHLLPTEDVRFGYGLVLTFGGLAFVAGLPLAGFITDVFETERGAFIFASGMFLISSLLELAIGIREMCGRKSSMIYTINSDVNTGNLGEMEVHARSEKNNPVSVGGSIHI